MAKYVFSKKKFTLDTMRYLIDEFEKDGNVEELRRQVNDCLQEYPDPWFNKFDGSEVFIEEEEIGDFLGYWGYIGDSTSPKKDGDPVYYVAPEWCEEVKRDETIKT